MTTITFDTLEEYTEQLRTFGVPEEQAKGHAKAMARLMERWEESRTKEEEARLKELATRGDIVRLEKEVELAKAELRKDIEAAKAETIKWMFGVAAGQAMFIIAFLKLFPSH
ncbi:MAG: hypothetical protein HQL82_17105 [Magnetococcales bacterium]|nr:hypothetical protein [Magnetococcales bacterium]